MQSDSVCVYNRVRTKITVQKESEVNQMSKIVGYRNMLSMTQSDMSKFLGISLQAYWNKEKGKTQFSDTEKVKIKQLLLPYFPDITIDDIFFNNEVLK